MWSKLLPHFNFDVYSVHLFCRSKQKPNRLNHYYVLSDFGLSKFGYQTQTKSVKCSSVYVSSRNTLQLFHTVYSSKSRRLCHLIGITALFVDIWEDYDWCYCVDSYSRSGLARILVWFEIFFRFFYFEFYFGNTIYITLHT